MAQLNFNAAQVAPDTGRPDPIPAGWYNVVMEASEMKPTANSTPQNPQSYLECKWNIVDGQYAGRKVFSRINLQNSNPQAVEIGFRQLSAIGHAVGHLNIGDSSELHGRPLKLKVTLRPARTDQATGQSYEASNDVAAYRNINDQSVQAGPTAQAAPQAPLVNNFAPPIGNAPTSWGAPAQAPQAFQMPAQAPQAFQMPAQAPQFAPPGAPQQGFGVPQQPQQPPQGAWQPPQGQQPWGQPQQPPQAPAMPPAMPPQYAPQQPPQGFQQQPPMAPPGFAAPAAPAANVPPFNPQSAMPAWAQPQPGQQAA